MSNSVIKYLKSLKQNKFRQKYNNFIVEGNKSLSMVRSQSTFKIECIAYVNGTEDNLKISKEEDFPIHKISSREMAQISLLKSPTDVFIVMKRRDFELTDDMKTIFYLDDVQDPGNVGTIIRIADWFGIGAIVSSENCASYYNPKVIQSSMGSFTNVALIRSNAEVLYKLGDYTWYGADMNGTSIDEIRLDDKSVMVLGNEGRGIGEKMRSKINRMVKIDGATGRKAESLNVATAAAILAHSLMKNY